MSRPGDATAGFGAFAYWPDDLEWSTQFMRLLGYIYVGGADFSEVHAVARDLPPGDERAWRAGFSALADAVEGDARAAHAGGHPVTARDAWLRASVYHRISGQLRAIGGAGTPPGVEAARRCFRAAMAVTDPPVAAVEIPYEGTTLPGYLVPPLRADGPGPAVAVIGGIDAFAEEMYLKIGRALGERGYRVLLFDGPGQGEARRRGVHARHDSEVPVAAAVDFLQRRDGVDPDRIGLIGSSLGGYYATRAAAFEHRLRACVVWGASEGIDAAKLAPGGPLAGRARQVQALFGLDDPAGLPARVAGFHLRGVPERIRCPVLILHGESDVLVPVEVARRTFDAVGHEDKRLITYPPGTPGCTHCQLDALSVAHRDICDWLDTRLRA